MELGKKGGSSKQLKQQSKKEQYTEVVYRIKGSSVSLHKFPKLRVWNGSREHFEIFPERIDGRESSGTDSDNNPDVIDVSLSSQYSASQPDDTVYEGDRLFPAAKSDSASSLSSSSPPRSSDDLLRENVNRDCNLTTSSSPSPQVNTDSKPALDKHNELYMISRDSSSSSEEMENNSPHRESVSRVSDVTNESSMAFMSPTQSPPIQVMDRSTGYDPSRIPASAFARSRSTIPQEWSVASNDSLFSLQIGNASFARDHTVIRDMHKSGEIQKSRELPPPIPQPPSPNAALKADNRPKRPPMLVVEIEKRRKETKKSGAVQVAVRTTENPAKPPPVDQNNGYKSGAIPSKSDKKSKEFDGKREKASPLPVRKKKSCCSCFSCLAVAVVVACRVVPVRGRSAVGQAVLSSRFAALGGQHAASDGLAVPVFKCSWPSCNCCTCCSWDSCHCWSCNLKNCCCHSSSENASSCSKPSCSSCFSKPSCCSSFRLSSCFSCCKFPCSYCCRRCC